jgi:tripartite-type tricarboxylate transporter receptor subunit TctC
MMEDKQIRALATSGPVRTIVTPDLPTAKEAGAQGYDVTSWNALFAPAGTPPEAIATLQKALAEVLADAEIKRKLLELGIEARAVSGADLSKRLEADIAKWGDVIAKAGIQKN